MKTTSRIRKRYRADYQFAMIMLFGLLASIVIIGFSIYRFTTGFTLGGFVNAAIAASVLLVMIYAARADDTSRAGHLFAIVTVAGCMTSTALFGSTGIFWGYVVLWINFLLTGRQFALAANLILILAMVFGFRQFDSLFETITYTVTASMVTIFGYIFAQRLSRYQSELEELALLDPLTYAGNRRMMIRDLKAAIAAHRRSGTDFMLVLIDLDNFKEINDALGHDVGDDALRRFADLLRAHTRAGDGLYRFGGEEFVLLISVHSRKEDRELVRKLHLRTTGRLKYDGMPVRYSAGAAVLCDGEDWPAWLRRADRAMYQAKRVGRNQVVFGENDATPDSR